MYIIKTIKIKKSFVKNKIFGGKLNEKKLRRNG